MRKTILPIFAVALSLLLPTSAAHAAGGIRWGNSFPAAMAQAKKSGRLIMVDFYTDWCGYCKKLDAETYTDPAVVQEAAQVIPIKLDAEHDGLSLAKQLRPHGFPAIYFLNSSGEVEGMIGGFEDAPRFLADLKRVVQVHHDLPGMESSFRANPNNLSLAAKLTAIYAGMGKSKKAQQTLARVARLDPDAGKGFLTHSTIAVAGMWMDHQQVDQAVPLLRKVARIARTPGDQAAGHINLAICYGVMNNFDACENELNTTMRLPNCPPQAKQVAEQMLARVQQVKNQGH